MRVILANPRGFCAGVKRAIDIVEKTLEKFGAPVYVRHEVVHNRHVVEGLRQKGAVFVEYLSQVPLGETVIFSAHGVSPKVWQEANERGLRVFDATCPLVMKVHREVCHYAQQGIECILIGHRGHPEVEGTLGHYDTRYGGSIYLVETTEDSNVISIRNPQSVAFVTQTTLSLEDVADIKKVLRDRFPEIQAPKRDDICYATQSRQEAVKQLARFCEVVLVMGSPNSSNANRLKECAARQGVPSFLIDDVEEIEAIFSGGAYTPKHDSVLGMTAGASTPEQFVQDVLSYLQEKGALFVENMVAPEEEIIFPLPKELSTSRNG